MSCQKPCWDQARLSSLVNKQVDLVWLGVSHPAPTPALPEPVRPQLKDIDRVASLEPGGWGGGAGEGAYYLRAWRS